MFSQVKQRLFKAMARALSQRKDILTVKFQARVGMGQGLTHFTYASRPRAVF
jgi:hypothetical protein